MRDFKYLLAYLIPLSAFLGIRWGGIYLYGPVLIAFGALPLIESLLPASQANMAPEAESRRAESAFFDGLLYLHVPILYGLLIYAFSVIHDRVLSTTEVIGIITCMGVMVGAFGINVGHELGHRSKAYERFFAKALLLPSLYMHFYVEHNLGHHKHVATDADPASARQGENVYAFWLRSVRDSYLHALKLDTHQVVIFQVIEAAYLGLIGLVFGLQALWIAIAIAAFGFLLLETVNYIEHYGLRRRLLPNGRYEAVTPQHSWNSNHELGRIFLYELTRHADHHYKSNRPYQLLRHFDQSPQLPMGYPASMLMALVPPLWFRVMDKRL